MKIEVDIEIQAPAETIWRAITDIENCAQMISGINEIKVLNQPTEGVVGLKWQETRLMFGKEATETMWITAAEENNYYQTRAESNGSIYQSKMSLQPKGSSTRLTMSFESEAQTILSKILSFIMNGLIKGSLKKVILQDLQDIKAFVESA